MASDRGSILAMDTATRQSIVALGAWPDAGAGRGSMDPGAHLPPAAVSRRHVQHRHGSQLLEQLEEVLAMAAIGLDAVGALAVGIGPGSFTGLRVGLATAKTLAHVRGLPLVGVATSEALRRAALAVGAPTASAIIMPAGAHDHYLARADAPAELIAPGALAEALGTTPAVSIDTDVLGAEPARLGAAAVAGLPDALLALARDRLGEGSDDDVAALVPAYVALPRGIRPSGEEVAWSPDLR